MRLSSPGAAPGLSQPVQDMSSPEPFIVIVGRGPRDLHRFADGQGAFPKLSTMPLKSPDGDLPWENVSQGYLQARAMKREKVVSCIQN